jgi:ABC-type oligopeptide transport system substrate-binding subunit
MKKETRIISLSILAVLTLCLLNVAAASNIPTAVPHSTIVTGVKTDVNVKQSPSTLTINAASGNSINGSVTITFSGRLTDANSNGIGGQTGYLTESDNGLFWVTMGGTNFTTKADGSWSVPAQFHKSFLPGRNYKYIAANCDGLSAQTMIKV